MVRQPEDWRTMPETGYFNQSGMGGVPSPGLGAGSLPPTPMNSAASGAPAGSAAAPTTFGGRGTAGRTSGGGGSPSTITQNYNDEINSSIYGGGSQGGLAGTIGNLALPGVAADPYSIVNQYYQSRFGGGLGSDSNTAQLAYQYWNPAQKMLGILGTDFSSDVGAINFGQQLLDRLSVGHGTQLDPIKMVQTVLQGIASESKKPGGTIGSTLSAIAHDPDPVSQLNSIMGVLQGVIEGTMPPDAAKAFLDQLSRAASRFASEWQRAGDPAAMEKSGQNIANAMLRWLGGVMPATY